MNKSQDVYPQNRETCEELSYRSFVVGDPPRQCEGRRTLRLTLLQRKLVGKGIWGQTWRKPGARNQGSKEVR